MSPITERAIQLWQQVPPEKLNQLPHSYDIRHRLAEEFNIAPTKAHNFPLAAIRIIRAGGKHPGGRPIGSCKPDSRETFSCRIESENLAKIRWLAKARGISQGKLVDGWIEAA